MKGIALIRNLSLGLALVVVSPLRAQVYTYDQRLPLAAGILDVSTGVQAYFDIQGTINQTVSINALASTIRFAGSYSFPSISFEATFQETQQVFVPPRFPNPGYYRPVEGDITVSLSLAAQTVAFDTGECPLSWVEGTAWSFMPQHPPVFVPITLNYSLVTEGLSYSDSLTNNRALLLCLPTTFDAANYPGSISLAPNPKLYIENLVFADILAANGFHARLAIVPEPSTLTLLLLGSFTVGIRLARPGASRNEAA